MAITAGQTVHASDLNALSGNAVSLTADSPIVNNSVTLVSTNLVIALLANTTYAIEGYIWHNASAPPDLKIGWLVPAGATGQWSSIGPYAAATPVAANKRINYTDFGVVPIANSLTFAGDTTFAQAAAVPRGFVAVSATAGNLTLQFAQGTATVVNTNVKAGSWIKVTPTKLV